MVTLTITINHFKILSVEVRLKILGWVICSKVLVNSMEPLHNLSIFANQQKSTQQKQAAEKGGQVSTNILLNSSSSNNIPFCN